MDRTDPASSAASLKAGLEPEMEGGSCCLQSQECGSKLWEQAGRGDYSHPSTGSAGA